jgi:hypothetical protein
MNAYFGWVSLWVLNPVKHAETEQGFETQLTTASINISKHVNKAKMMLLCMKSQKQPKNKQKNKQKKLVL